MKRTSSSILAAVLLVSSASLAQPKNAKPTATPASTPAPAAAPAAAAAPAVKPLAESLTGTARAEYAAGKVLYMDGDYAGALVKYQVAYEASKDPRLLFNVAACEKALRHYAKVVKLLEDYKTKAGPMLSADDKKEADELLANLKPLVSPVRVTVSEPDADVYIDDQKIGTSPINESFLVDLGARKLTVRKAGFKDKTETVNASGAGEIAINVQLEKDVHEGLVIVRAGKGDTISIDGKVVGSDRWEGKLPSGGHSVRVTNEGKRAFTSEVLVNDAQTRTLEVTLEAEKSGGVPAWVWVTGGVVVAAGAGVGGYFLFKGDTTQAQPVSGTIQPGVVTLPSFSWR